MLTDLSVYLYLIKTKIVIFVFIIVFLKFLIQIKIFFLSICEKIHYNNTGHTFKLLILIKEYHFFMRTIVFDVDNPIYDQQQLFRKAINTVFPQVKQANMYLLYIRFHFSSDDIFLKVMADKWSLKRIRFFELINH